MQAAGRTKAEVAGGELSMDKLLEHGKMLAEDIFGSGWSLIEFAGKRFWIHVRSRKVLESSSQNK